MAQYHWHVSTPFVTLLKAASRKSKGTLAPMHSAIGMIFFVLHLGPAFRFGWVMLGVVSKLTFTIFHPYGMIHIGRGSLTPADQAGVQMLAADLEQLQRRSKVDEAASLHVMAMVALGHAKPTTSGHFFVTIAILEDQVLRCFEPQKPRTAQLNLTREEC